MQNTGDYRDGGTVSQWNEGNLKNIRLHEAQELINTSKISPLEKQGTYFGYQLWIAGVEILYGEGYSKYKSDEIEVIERIKIIINNKLMLYPPIKVIVINSVNSQERSSRLNYKNWEELKKLIELFEQKVKLYNDKHGLSTKNYDYDDEGL